MQDCNSIPSASVQSLNCQCGIPKKHASPSSRLFSTNKRHCDFACVEKLPIPCSNKKVAVDKTLQCHLEENSPKRILPARLLRWQRDTGHPGIDIDTADPSLERTLTRSPGQFGEKFSTSKMTEFLIRNWRQKVWV